MKTKEELATEHALGESDRRTAKSSFLAGFEAGVEARGVDLTQFADAVRDMCRDYSSRDGNVYILDVLGSIDALEKMHSSPQAVVDTSGNEEAK